ncbi:aminopeptidase C [Arachidicoccus sp.]|uniref:aminopeptidase C n=1 Tax=Arachidicoccus sp. TaxID=1872624 RepID=UPI003D1A76CF
MKKIFLSVFIVVFVVTISQAQTDLIKKVNKNQSTADANGFAFTKIRDLTYTPVENQGRSGTCWSYSTNSFLESEMIKAGKRPLHLSKIFSARCAYLDKAENYLRMDGNVNFGDGGQAHDVINMYAKYGAMPESTYTGLIKGATENDFGDMLALVKTQLNKWLAQHNIPTNWRDTVSAILDAHLGKVPAHFTFEGKSYTPKTFANEYVGLDPKNYIEIMSQTNTPYWQQGMLMVPDNWEFVSNYFNVPLDDLTKIIDDALKNGYTVEWDTDCSEPYFNWLSSVAIVPPGADTISAKTTTKEEIKDWFNEPKTEMNITPENRQAAYNDKQTTDDHLMHIVGLAKDQNGKEYYIVKNSWGTKNIYKGFLYASKAYINYKTVAIMINKNALTEEMKAKLKL